MHYPSTAQRGFTLIELSIVLVIIGLIVGGVLVGQDLIRAAGVRATISQIEKYNTAVNTFRDKYGGLPGDLSASLATQFGFTPRAGTQGQGDGNGIIEAPTSVFGSPGQGAFPGAYEQCMFWVDLTTANGQHVNMIDGSFSGGPPGVYNSGNCSSVFTNATGPAIGLFYPEAKLGAGNYIYVWSGGFVASNSATGSNGLNYFGIYAINNAGGAIWGNPELTVQQAYSMDTKIDDGVAMTGRVTAVYIASGSTYTAPSADPDSATTCFNSTTKAYSMSVNNGQGVNCALSFQFQ